jgi:tungstate transport system ATP-binding protein
MDNVPSEKFASQCTPVSAMPLQLDRVTYQAGGNTLVDQVSLQIFSGARYIILGPNGSGKSLLLRLMHGLIEPSSGRVLWQRESANSRDGEGAKLQAKLQTKLSFKTQHAMVFQQPVMLRRSALDNIKFALKMARFQGDLDLLAQEALKRVGLSSLADRPARRCSVGEQQRLALARAWAVKPEVLFLDEPSASLDPSATRLVEEIINAMHAEGTTIVMASHDLGQARRLADRVIFLHQGQMIEDLAAAAFFEGAGSELAQAFMKGELLC